MATLLPNDDVPRDVLKGYRIFVWSQDHHHPPHVHVRKGKDFSTWNLRTLECIDEGKFSSSELVRQRKLLRDLYDDVVRSWHAHWQAKKSQS